MVQCGACGKFLAAVDVAKCNKCVASYHRQCVNIKKGSPLPTTWHCPECKKNLVRDNRTETPVRSSTHVSVEDSQHGQMDAGLTGRTVLDVAREPASELKAVLTTYLKLELTNFKEEFLNTVRQEFQLMRNDLTELRLSLSAANERIAELEKRVATVEDNKRVQPPVRTDLEDVITQLRNDINDRDQDLISNDLQIAHLPESSGENPTHTAILVATKLGVTVEARDIVSAERVGGRRINATQPAGPQETRPRFLVVRFARRELCTQMLEAAKARRGLTSADLEMTGPPTRFYINERLTKKNRELFRRAREAGGRLGWQFVWCKRGRILARNKPGDSVRAIRCDADLIQVFGNEPNPESNDMA